VWESAQTDGHPFETLRDGTVRPAPERHLRRR
jgi:hypothetical protein